MIKHLPPALLCSIDRMTQKPILCLFGLLLALPTPSIQASVWYIRPMGSDVNRGINWVNPTLAMAAVDHKLHLGVYGILGVAYTLSGSEDLMRWVPLAQQVGAPFDQVVQ